MFKKKVAKIMIIKSFVNDEKKAGEEVTSDSAEGDGREKKTI